MLFSNWRRIFGKKTASQSRKRQPLRSVLSLESLEDRIVPSTFYVDDSYDITNDQGAPGLDNGDTVTFALGEPGEETGLIFGTDAFSTIQAAIDAASSGDSVQVAPGTYNESPSITKSLTLEGVSGRDVTTINLQTGPGYLGALYISGVGNNVTVTGFTITGRDGTSSVIAASNILLDAQLGTVSITDNRFRIGLSHPDTSTGDDGFGIVTSYSETTDTAQLTVQNNIFEPLTTQGTRAFYINPGVNNFNFEDNQITGGFTRIAITQAKNGVVNGNTVTGTGASAGLGTYGYPDPDVYGQTTFSNNTITQTANGISIFDTNNVTVENNIFDTNGTDVRTVDFGDPGDASTIVVNNNSFTNTTGFAVSNGYPTGTIDATGNWFGTTNPAAIAALINGSVDSSGFLTATTTLQTQINNAAPGDTINIAPGTYSGLIVDKNLTLDGGGGGVFIIGGSPALTVTSGQVIVQNGVTLSTSTDDPTVLVQSGGNLTLRDSTVQESTGFNQAAIIVESGGLLDLGTSGDLGGNIININGAGSLLDNQDDTGIPALGNTWQQDGVAITNNFTLEEEINHALDAAGRGLVRYVAGNVYVTPSSGSIQRGVDAASSGDTINVAAGTYNESPNITKSLTLQGAGRDVTTINLQTGPAYLGALEITGMGNNVTVDGFTITGRDGTSSVVAASNILLGTQLGTVSITNNRLRIGLHHPATTTGDDGFGIVTTYSETTDTAQLTVQNNIFEPLTTQGTRAFYINPGVDGFNFEDNQITGGFVRTAITQAKDGLVDGNTVTGTGSSAGLGTWGYPDPDVYGQTTFTNNNISQTQNAITVFETNNVVIQNNTLNNNGIGIRSLDLGSFSNLLDESTNVYSPNNITNSAIANITLASLQTQINNAAPGATINIAPGTYSGVFVDKDITLDGGGGGVFIVGASPALTVTNGQVIVQNGVTLSVGTNDPTVVVESGGSLKLRTSTVHESTGFDQVAIEVQAGGLLDLGTTGDLGGNLININGAGSFIDNQDDTGIPALGNTWQQGGVAITNNFTIEDEIQHALDVAGLGLVRYVANNVYVTTNSGNIERGVDAATAGDTVNVAAGTYAELVEVDKAVNLRGAQADVDARTRAALPESIVGMGDGAFQILADNVTINGFTVQGVINDPSMVITALGSGIWTNPGFSGTDGGHQILNNIIQNNISGLELANSGTIQTKVQFNLFQNNNAPGAGSGVGIRGDFSLDNALVDSNTFLNHNERGILIFGATDSTFSNNAITGRGIGIGGGDNLDFTNNNINGAGATGISLSGVTNADVIENTISGKTSAGILFGSSSTGTIQRNTVTSSLTGIEINASSATITNNFSNSNTTGILFASGATGSANHNDLSGNSGLSISNTTGVDVDASANWYGTNTAAGVAAEVSANVDFTPWLHVGTDGDLGTAGFQGNFATLHVDDAGPQVGGGRITEAIGLLAATGTIIIHSGTYTETVSTAGKAVTLSPGDSPGLVTIMGDLTLDGNDTVVIELNGTTAGSGFDQIVVTGATVLGNASLLVTRGFNPAVGTPFLIIDGGASTTPGFAGLPDNAIITVNGVDFRINYSGADVQLTTVTTVSASAGLTFTDEDGDVYKIKLSGPGTFSVSIDDGNSNGRGPIDQITLMGTNSLTSRMTISILRKVGDGEVSIGSVTGTGLKSFIALKSDLVGAGFNLSGSLGSLVLDDILHGADVTTGAAPNQSSSISVDLIASGTEFDIGTPINRFRATAMEEGKITAPSLNALRIRGDFDADLDIAGALNSANIRGSLGDADWDIGGDVRTLAVKELASNWDLHVAGMLRKATLGDANNVSINVDGSVRTFTTATFIGSELFAGFTSTGPMTGTFNTAQSISSFKVKDRQVAAFDNSTVAAATIGKVSLSSVRDTTVGDFFGILADLSIGSVKVRQPAFTFDVTLSTPQGFGKFQVDIQ